MKTKQQEKQRTSQPAIGQLQTETKQNQKIKKLKPFFFFFCLTWIGGIWPQKGLEF